MGKLPIRPRELLPEPEPTPSPKEDPPSLLTKMQSRKRPRPSRKPSPPTRLSSSTPRPTVTLPLLKEGKEDVVRETEQAKKIAEEQNNNIDMLVKTGKPGSTEDMLVKTGKPGSTEKEEDLQKPTGPR